MKLLLDTHVLLWLTLKPELLPQAMQERLGAQEARLVVSAASAWEISIKHHAGKLPEGAPLLRDFEGAASRLDATLLPVTPAHALRAGALHWAHRDPFDRVLVAQAQQEGMWLVTLDEHIRGFGDTQLLR